MKKDTIKISLNEFEEKFRDRDIQMDAYRIIGYFRVDGKEYEVPCADYKPLEDKFELLVDNVDEYFNLGNLA